MSINDNIFKAYGSPLNKSINDLMFQFNETLAESSGIPQVDINDVGVLKYTTDLPVYIEGETKSVFFTEHFSPLHENPQNVITGGIYYWDKEQYKIMHNGGTIIDPNRIYQFPTADFSINKDLWYSEQSAGLTKGCWVKIMTEKSLDMYSIGYPVNASYDDFYFFVDKFANAQQYELKFNYLSIGITSTEQYNKFLMYFGDNGYYKFNFITNQIFVYVSNGLVVNSPININKKYSGLFTFKSNDMSLMFLPTVNSFTIVNNQFQHLVTLYVNSNSTSEINIGDYIVVKDFFFEGSYKKDFEGCFLITNKGTNYITYRNTSRLEILSSTQGSCTARINFIKTSITFNNTEAVKLDGTELSMEGLVLKGNNSGFNGITLLNNAKFNYFDENNPDNAFLGIQKGDTFAVLNFDIGVYANGVNNLDLQGFNSLNNTKNGYFLENCSFNISKAIANANILKGFVFKMSNGYSNDNKLLTSNNYQSINSYVLENNNVLINDNGNFSISPRYYNSNKTNYFNIGLSINGNTYFYSNTTARLALETTGNFFSATDNTASLGKSTFRWSVVYAGTGTINTSDARLKTFYSVEKAERATARKLKANLRKYKFNDAIENKGEEEARIHYGVSAQEVADIFIKNGLNPNKYALFCYDKWDYKPAEYDNEGNLLVEEIKAGDRYGIRYDELLVFILMGL